MLTGRGWFSDDYSYYEENGSLSDIETPCGRCNYRKRKNSTCSWFPYSEFEDSELTIREVLLQLGGGIVCTTIRTRLDKFDSAYEAIKRCKQDYGGSGIVSNPYSPQ
jgi:hypothetical protein